MKLLGSILVSNLASSGEITGRLTLYIYFVVEIYIYNNVSGINKLSISNIAAVLGLLV